MVERFGPLPPQRVVMVETVLPIGRSPRRRTVHRVPANLFVCQMGLEFDPHSFSTGVVRQSVMVPYLAGSVGLPPAPEAILDTGSRRADLYEAVAYLTGFGKSDNAIQMMMHHTNKPAVARGSPFLRVWMRSCLASADEVWQILGQIELLGRRNTPKPGGSICCKSRTGVSEDSNFSVHLFYPIIVLN